MPEWMVQLLGPERDLRFLDTTLRNADCRVAEDHGEFYLRASCFAALAGAGEVKTAADEMIERANLAALLRVNRYWSVRTAGVLGRAGRGMCSDRIA
jgi:hypothetical protein